MYMANTATLVRTSTTIYNSIIQKAVNHANVILKVPSVN